MFYHHRNENHFYLEYYSNPISILSPLFHLLLQRQNNRQHLFEYVGCNKFHHRKFYALCHQQKLNFHLRPSGISLAEQNNFLNKQKHRSCYKCIHRKNKNEKFHCRYLFLNYKIHQWTSLNHHHFHGDKYLWEEILYS